MATKARSQDGAEQSLLAGAGNDAQARHYANQEAPPVRSSPGRAEVVRFGATRLITPCCERSRIPKIQAITGKSCPRVCARTKYGPSIRAA
jgi:hypothetical protein